MALNSTPSHFPFISVWSLQVTDSINHMINICMTSAPGQKECDMALRQIQAMLPLLGNPSEPINDGTYFECLDGVIERSRIMAASMTGQSGFCRYHGV